MKLSNTKIQNLESNHKPYKVFDGDGLYLQINPNGSKLWRLRYYYNDKEKLVSLGKYPVVSLKDAREKAIDVRRQLDKGIDPTAKKREEKLKKKNDFEKVASEWWVNQKDRWTEEYAQTVWRRLERDALPWLKSRPVNELTTAELLQVLRRIESRGTVDTAHRICQYLNNIGIFAVACGYIENNPANNLVKALKSTLKRNMAAITDPKQIGPLLRAIDTLEGSFTVRQILRIAPLLFARPGELRRMEWNEVDFDTALWTIPASKTKKRREHLVPLSEQALKILQETHPATGSDEYVFPSVRAKNKPLSENTINASLRRLGYTKEEMTGHGFRTMASTNLHELGFRSEIIERQLAHIDKNQIRGTYNKAEYLDERRKLMQSWSDCLDALKK